MGFTFLPSGIVGKKEPGMRKTGDSVDSREIGAGMPSMVKPGDTGVKLLSRNVNFSRQNHRIQRKFFLRGISPQGTQLWMRRQERIMRKISGRTTQ